MDGLIGFLRARLDARELELDEDERLARAAADHGGDWRGSDDGIYPSDAGRHIGPIIVGSYGYLDDQYANHITRWDPARVLRKVADKRADIEAKRRILEDLGSAVGLELPAGVHDGRDAAERERDAAAHGALRNVALHLAEPFRQHPDFRREWAVTG